MVCTGIVTSVNPLVFVVGVVCVSVLRCITCACARGSRHDVLVGEVADLAVVDVDRAS